MYDYKAVEEKLNRVISHFALQLGDEGVTEVSDFISYGEYGEAFDLLCHILAQKRLPIPPDIYELLVGLGKQMELEASVWRQLEPLAE